MDNGSVEVPVVSVMELESAALLAELASVFRDLQFVVDACDRLIALAKEEPNDPTLIQALWSSAVVAYIRCFTTGVRFRLTESDLDQLPLDGDVLGVHRWLKDLRDKHVAHSVNPFEAISVGAILSADQATRSIDGVATLSMHHIAADEQGVQGLRSLAAALASTVADRARLQTEVVLHEARKLDLDTLYGRERLRVTAPGPDEASRRR